MTDANVYADELYDDMFPWRDTTPEEYMAHHWLEFGAFSVTKNNQFRNGKLREWLSRFEEIFHDTALIEQCRELYLTDTQRAKQQQILDKIWENGY